VREGPNALRPPSLPPALAPLLARFRLEPVSCVWWRTPRDWSIPERTIPDTLLFVPARGAVDVAVSGRWRRCLPGQVVVLPEGVAHAARYAPGCRSWDMVAVHLVLDDPWRWHFAAGFRDHVLPLSDAPFWLGRLARLTGLLAADRASGLAHGADLLRLLLADLVWDGAAVRLPQRRADPRIAAALQAIDAEPGHANVAQLAHAAGLSPARFRVLFAAATGMAPKPYLGERQLRLAARLLRGSARSVREVAAECGFANDHYFHRVFKQRYGATPSTWRRAGTGP
jgi:AraC-like DNA-binding protein